MIRVQQYAVATVPALIILGFFVWFANWIPQTEWDPPEKQDIGASMTPAQLAVVGHTIALQRGCMACHTIELGAGVQGGGRGPNWSGLAARRAQGVTGGPDNLVDYLAQALYEPGAYLVEGYADIMPAATSAPAKLTYEEVVAVVNYLQSLGGTPTAELGDIPRPSGETAGGGVATGGASSAGASITNPVEIFSTFLCATCHSLERGVVLVGPPLDAANLEETASGRGVSPRAYVIESIVNPGAFEKEGTLSGVMPPTFGDQMTAGQLEALLDYLLSSGGGQ
jgi:mono/diheme cytochrome c family protein